MIYFFYLLILFLILVFLLFLMYFHFFKHKTPYDLFKDIQEGFYHLNKEFLWEDAIHLKKPTEKQKSGEKLNILKKSGDKEKAQNQKIQKSSSVKQPQKIKQPKKIEKNKKIEVETQKRNILSQENNTGNFFASASQKYNKTKSATDNFSLNSENYKNFLNLIKDENLLSILREFKEKDLIKFQEGSHGNTSEETEKYLREKILDYLKDKYESTKYQVSLLRRKGIDTKMIDFKLMSVPLKIKIFKSTSSKKDFDTLTGIFERINKDIQSHSQS